MLDKSESRLLDEIRRWEDPGPPSWKEAWWNYLLVAGGIALILTDALETGRISGAAGGFMLGVGVLALFLCVTLSRRLRDAYRLVRKADASHAFAGDEPS